MKRNTRSNEKVTRSVQKLNRLDTTHTDTDTRARARARAN